MKWLVKFVKEDEGATAIEYAIMAAVIVGVVILVGGKTNSAFTKTDTAFGTIP
jgi:Flp pilus assembly pilin Flp